MTANTTPAQPISQLSALAANEKHYLLASWLGELQAETIAERRRLDGTRINGMLAAYLEQGVITHSQFKALSDELNAYVWGQA